MADQANQIRIISGIWRSRKIPVLNRPGLRPSSDRVRETLFNWLGRDLSNLRVLDLFAGSGALGFEAASRGANWVTLIEKERTIYANLEKQLTLLNSSPCLGKVNLICEDATVFLDRQAGSSWDLIFIDPPFASYDLFEKIVIQAAHCCDPHAGGRIYIECPTKVHLEDILVCLGPSWQLAKQMKTTQVQAFLFSGRSS